MLELALGLPRQMREAEGFARAAEWTALRRRAVGKRCVVVAGMGGSGIGGELLRGLLAGDSALPIICCRDYDVPAAVTRDCLFFAVSYSGNTEETVAAFEQATKRRCPMVAVTSGGRLDELAHKAGATVVRIPSGLPPRAALGYLFVPLLIGFERLGVCRSFRVDREEAVRLMEARAPALRRKAARLAGRFDDRMPVIYSTSRLLDACAVRWQCQLNENAKVMCHVNVLPELSHNEIVGMGGPEFLSPKTMLVALLDRMTHPRTRMRLEHLFDITASGYAEAIRLETEGKSALARLFSLLILGDLVSVELARRRGVDPMSVARIDELKQRMKEKSEVGSRKAGGRKQIARTSRRGQKGRSSR